MGYGMLILLEVFQKAQSYLIWAGEKEAKIIAMTIYQPNPDTLKEVICMKQSKANHLNKSLLFLTSVLTITIIYKANTSIHPHMM